MIGSHVSGAYVFGSNVIGSHVFGSHVFSSCAKRQRHELTLSFDWLIGLCVFFVIGWSDYFAGFCFHDTQTKTSQSSVEQCEM